MAGTKEGKKIIKEISKMITDELKEEEFNATLSEIGGELKGETDDTFNWDDLYDDGDDDDGFDLDELL